jgi:hypothetical protein
LLLVRTNYLEPRKVLAPPKTSFPPPDHPWGILLLGENPNTLPVVIGHRPRTRRVRAMVVMGGSPSTGIGTLTGTGAITMVVIIMKVAIDRVVIPVTILMQVGMGRRSAGGATNRSKTRNGHTDGQQPKDPVSLHDFLLPPSKTGKEASDEGIQKETQIPRKKAVKWTLGPVSQLFPRRCGELPRG